MYWSFNNMFPLSDLVVLLICSLKYLKWTIIVEIYKRYNYFLVIIIRSFYIKKLLNLTSSLDIIVNHQLIYFIFFHLLSSSSLSSSSHFITFIKQIKKIQIQLEGCLCLYGFFIDSTPPIQQIWRFLRIFRSLYFLYFLQKLDNYIN